MSGMRRAPSPACNTDSAEQRVPRALFVTQAAMNGNERAVKLLLRKGANVNHRDQYLQTACMWVALLAAAGVNCTWNSQLYSGFKLERHKVAPTRRPASGTSLLRNMQTADPPTCASSAPAAWEPRPAARLL